MKSFADEHPELIDEWSTQNGDLRPEEVSYGSNKKVWWNGKCGHTWQATIKNRSNGSSCPFCSGHSILSGDNDLQSNSPDVAAEWSDKNLPLKPSGVTVRSNKKVWWKCKECGYEWQSRIADRSEGHGCPACAGSIVLAGNNDLSTRYPKLAEEWGEENSGRPDTYSTKSRENVWWNCKRCGYHWKAVINARVKGQECPLCKSRRKYMFKRNNKSDKTQYMVNLIKALAAEKRLKISFQDESDIGIPLGIYFPEKKVALEFTNTKENRGAKRRWENAKNWLCFNSGIHLIRIIAPGAKTYDNCECVIRSNNKQSEAYKVVKKIMGKI